MTAMVLVRSVQRVDYLKRASPHCLYIFGGSGIWLPLIVRLSDCQELISYNSPGRPTPYSRLQGPQFFDLRESSGAGEEVVCAVEDMVKDQGYSDGTLHNSIVNVMFWINQKMNTNL
jgi:hypothetical protein